MAGTALEALAKVDSVAAYNEAKRLAAFPAKGDLSTAITSTMIAMGDESSADVILKNFEEMPVSQEKFEALQPLSTFLSKMKNEANFRRGIDAITKFVMDIPENFRGQVSGFVENILKNIQKAKTASGEKPMADYVDEKLKKKDF